MRYEATVGAGLPVLDTFRKLVESGDRVLRVEGCVSGTLGFVLSALDAGQVRSPRRVREAMARGYTEPDPREDLSGRGRAAQGADPRAPARLRGRRARTPRASSRAALAGVTLAQFLERLPAHDEPWRERVSREAARGPRAALRRGRDGARRLGRAAAPVPRDSPFGSLQGTRNLLSFTTRRYRAEPLVVAGPGAGPEVTAAGILNDIHALGME